MKQNPLLRLFVVVALATGALLGFQHLSAPHKPEKTTEHPAASLQKAVVSASYGKIPLHFEANEGQAGSAIDFLARGKGYGVFIQREGFQMVMGAGKTADSMVRMSLLGASCESKPVPQEKLPGVINYRIGNDKSKWRTGVPTYARVQYPQVWPGVDLVYYGNQRQMQYDFTVAPGTSPSVIAWKIDGAEKLSVNPAGELVLSLKRGDLVMKKPFLYQEIDGAKKAVEGGFELADNSTVRFAVGAYDTSKPLVIDPTLEYSTFLDGSVSEWANAIATDAQGNAYIAGCTFSTSAVSGSSYPIAAGATISPATYYFSGSLSGTYVQTTGTLVSGTYIKTTGTWTGTFTTPGVYLVSGTYYAPTSGTTLYTSGTYKTPGETISHGTFLLSGTQLSTGTFTMASGTYTTGRFMGSNTVQSNGDAFVTKVSPDGTRVIFTTYLGGTERDYASGVAVNGSWVYITGETFSTDLFEDNDPKIIGSIPMGMVSIAATPPWGSTTMVQITNPDTGVPSYYVQQTGIFTVSRTGDVSKALTVNFSYSLTQSDSKLASSTMQVTIPAGYRSATFAAPTSISDGKTAPVYTTESSVTIEAGSGYVIDTHKLARVYFRNFQPSEYPVADGYSNAVVYPDPNGVSTFYSISAVEPSVGEGPGAAWQGCPSEGVFRIYRHGAAEDGYPNLQFLQDATSPGNAIPYPAPDWDYKAYVLTYEGTVLTGSYDLSGSSGFFPFGFYDTHADLHIKPTTDTLYEEIEPVVAILDGGFVSGQTDAISIYDTNGGSSEGFVASLNKENGVLGQRLRFGGDHIDTPSAIAVDISGNVYVTGETYSDNFPTTHKASQSVFSGVSDAFVLKFSGSALNSGFDPTPVYSSYYGGGARDAAFGIAVDAAGAAYITGFTASVAVSGVGGIPLAPQGGVIQDRITVDAPDETRDDFPGSRAYDAFVAKFNPLGTSPLEYSTYLGGGRYDIGHAIALDTRGNAYVTGETRSTSMGPTNFQGHDTPSDRPFPTRNAFQTYDMIPPNPAIGLADPKLALPSLSNAFVTKVNSLGTVLIYSTYLGGSSNDYATGIAVDTAGRAYITGYTESADMPSPRTLAVSQFPRKEDAFVSGIDVDGKMVMYTTYVGGDSADYGRGIALTSNANNQAWPASPIIAGETYSNDYPTTAGAAYRGRMGSPTVFVSKIKDEYTDLSITGKYILASGTAKVGEDFTYQITVKNNGPSEASRVVIDQTLPAGVKFVSSSSPFVTLTSNTPWLSLIGTFPDSSQVRATLELLDPGKEYTYTVVVTPLDTGKMRSVLSVKSDVYDPIPTNNSQTVELTAGPGDNNVSITTISPTGTENRSAFTLSTGWQNVTPSLVFRVSRSGKASGILNVNLAVDASSTATEGEDFTTPPRIVTIPDGKSYVDVTVDIVDDTLTEGLETVVMKVLDGAGYTVAMTGSRATGVIEDDDTGLVTITKDASPAIEGGTNGRFVLTRTGTATGELTVYYTVAGTATNGIDYVDANDPYGSQLSGAVTFAAGSTKAYLTIKARDDGIYDPDETVIIKLAKDASASSSNGGVPAYNLGGMDEASIYIQDSIGGAGEVLMGVSASVGTVSENGSSISSSSISTTSVTNNGGSSTSSSTISGGALMKSTTGQFTIWRTGPTLDPITVAYRVVSGTGAATEGVDYQSLSGWVTIASGSSSAVVPVEVIDDDLIEGDENVTIELMEMQGYTIRPSFKKATVKIQDDELAKVSVVSVTPSILEGGSPGRFTFRRTGDATGSLTVNYTLAGSATVGTDYDGPTGAVTFPAGDKSVDVPVQALADEVNDPNETIVLKVVSGPSYTTGSPYKAMMSIDGTVSIAQTSTRASESGQVGRLTFNRTGNTSQPLEVEFYIDGSATLGDDYTLRSKNGVLDVDQQTLTIPAGKSSASLEVVPVDDKLVEFNETVIIGVDWTPASSYNVSEIYNFGRVTIVDNDKKTKKKKRL